MISDSGIYTPDDFRDVIERGIDGVKIIKTNKKIEYYNAPISFDIETSSFLDQGEKRALMYEWTFCLNGIIVIGRTWDEFIRCMDELAEDLKLCSTRRIVIYVHNLSYEFQFMRKFFRWVKIFAMDDRKPIYAITESGIEFRCSYILSGYGLAKLAENLTKYRIKKLVGDLDYNLIRTPITALFDDEIAYCVNDALIVVYYIQERIDLDGNITAIPLTKTGYVRHFCKNNCLETPGVSRWKSRKFWDYRNLMQALTVSSKEYRMLKRAFQGGFTHSCPFYTGKILEKVHSDDFTSSYPAQIVMQKYPMSSSEIVKITSDQEFRRNLNLYCCLFNVHFVGLESLVYFDNYLSISRCYDVKRPTVSNGRIVRADELYTTITEQDFFIIEQCYTWDRIEIGTFRRYEKGYLPTDFIRSVLELYRDKTSLKGVEGKEVEYLRSKEMINSCYGMMVTDIVRPEITYSGDTWGIEPVNYETVIEKYNHNPGRFLFFPWGVWVCAYARRALWTGIFEFGRSGDYVYSDTDSVKTLHREDHAAYFEKYNAGVITKLRKAMEFHKLPFEMVAPKTIKGKEKILGVWDYEGCYDRFKTLGAKRYMVEESGEISITVSGLNKKVTVPWMLEGRDNDAAFKMFDNDLYVPAEATGKNIHMYIDYETSGTVTDYQGESYNYNSPSGVHLGPAEYSLSMAQEYIDYLKGLQL